ncbi:MAG: HEAT repeat domain-containing protein, partial [Gemmatimonadales bacterium]
MQHRLRPALLLCIASLGVTLPLRAQAGAAVEQVAQLLAAEDARRYDETTFGVAMAQPDPLVRRVAARAIGRIGSPDGLPLLVRALADDDSTVQTEAAFALGQLADSEALPALVNRLSEPRPLLASTVAEIVAAIAKIGGPAAGAEFRALLGGSGLSDEGDRWIATSAVVRESWRLGRDAPVDQLLPYLETDSTLTRVAAFYTLGRLRAVSAGNRMLAGLRDPHPQVRAWAARTLTRAYADSARLGHAGVIGQLGQACADDDAGVRIQAARSLGSFRGESVRGFLGPLLLDQMPNVAVAAAEALGAAREQAAAADLKVVASGKGFFALRRAALLSLARTDSAAFAQAQGPWARSTDWRDRAAAAEGWGLTGGSDSSAMAAMLADRDLRVVGAALQGWSDATTDPSPRLVAAARVLLTSSDVAVRSLSADVLAREADPADVAGLVKAYRISALDSVPDAAFSILGA